MKTIFLTIFALFAFAGNSIICRLALKGEVIDASSFTVIRLVSGIVFLIMVVIFKNKGKFDHNQGRWLSALFLFLYMSAFSFAYISLDTGVGALILFGFVQLTMVLVSIIQGKKLQAIEWSGLIVAFSGLTFLLLPSATAPSLFGFLLMAISGIAWGFYTLAGKNCNNPLLHTANNFLRTLPFIILLTLLSFDRMNISTEGVILAVVSGAIASALGYVIWYATLKNLSITQASTLQLTVPIIAIFGGVIFADENITLTLLLSSSLVLGGILLVMVANVKNPMT